MHDPAIRPSTTFDRRRAGRVPVSLVADYRRSGRPPFKVRIADLSEVGCACESVAMVHVGDRIWLSIGDLAPIEAVIRWATPFGFGCEWVRPLHISVFDHIRSRRSQRA